MKKRLTHYIDKIKSIRQVTRPQVYEHVGRHKIRYSVVTVLLLLLAFVSTGGMYIMYKYWYPPYLSIKDSEIAYSIVMHTNKGDITVAIDRDTRFPAAHFTHLVRSGFYTGTRIHRVVPDLLIEGGDPLTRYPELRSLWSEGGFGTAFPNEIKYVDVTAGTVVFSSSAANTYGSQFAIITKDTPWLKGKQTIIGHVVTGMDVVKQIEHTPVSVEGFPKEDIVITSFTTL